ncbi:hypothetical protein V6N13_129745 [Hibiscus sabdariffa]
MEGVLVVTHSNAPKTVVKTGLPANFSKTHFPTREEVMTAIDEEGHEHRTIYLARKAGLNGGWKGFAVAHEMMGKLFTLWGDRFRTTNNSDSGAIPAESFQLYKIITKALANRFRKMPSESPSHVDKERMENHGICYAIRRWILACPTIDKPSTGEAFLCWLGPALQWGREDKAPAAWLEDAC